ncbi:MAG TPA: septal ring lytic transglycosylase RlpA family protein [Solirubrobacteraceae bacterium]|nr:septal ring lytic transglycosylase RlpA family protein [Solirubrobacteraceae bacterium]
MIGIPASAAALSAGHAFAQPAPERVHITPHSQHITYGQELVMDGTESVADAGHTVALQFAGRGASAWSDVSSTTVGGDGRFRLTARLERSGDVRALDTSSGVLTAFVTGRNTTATQPMSSTVPVDVDAALRVRARRIAVLAGQTVLVRGRLLSALAGRKVSLQARQSGAWRTLTTTRTRAAGRFVLRYVTGAAGQAPIRVRFAGDQLNGRAAVRAGNMTVYRLAGASWYNDAGQTACGFHAYLGVANRTLPCGTTVSFRYNGRSVNATVDDRGPYVGGRDWDLNQNTAAALGFGGVGTVWSSQ